MALSAHFNTSAECPLSGVKQTSQFKAFRSAFAHSGHRPPTPLPRYSPESIGYGQPICGPALMKRRATTGGKVGKARRRKTQSRRAARVVARRGSPNELDQT